MVNRNNCKDLQEDQSSAIMILDIALPEGQKNVMTFHGSPSLILTRSLFQINATMFTHESPDPCRAAWNRESESRF